MADKYLYNNSGVITEKTAAIDGGGTYANQIPALDANGKLTNAMMPTGVGAESITATAVGAIANGDFVNLYNSSGLKVRKANASSGLVAHGFVLVGVADGATATVYFSGKTNTAVASPTLVIGDKYYLSATGGLATATPPTTTGYYVQYLGIALSSTSLNFAPAAPIVLA
jgi:hypothetical protein